MVTWFLLAAAIVSEVAATLSLKAALDQPAWYVVVVTGYVGSLVLLAAVLRAGMALGVAYGIWGAIGVALTAALGALLYGERLTALVVAGMVLVAAGVLVVELGSQRARAEGSGR